MFEPTMTTYESNSRPSRLALVGIVLLAACVRLLWLDSVPPAINQDEAVHAWDANCLLNPLLIRRAWDRRRR